MGTPVAGRPATRELASGHSALPPGRLRWQPCGLPGHREGTTAPVRPATRDLSCELANPERLTAEGPSDQESSRLHRYNHDFRQIMKVGMPALSLNEILNRDGPLALSPNAVCWGALFFKAHLVPFSSLDSSDR